MEHFTWADDPIAGASEDRFGWSGFAAHVAGLIVRSHTWKSSIVFSLTGPWGSGKSSLINLVVGQVAKNGSDWVIVRFTPWSTSDSTGMLTEFYATLSSGLPKDRGAEFAQIAGKLLAAGAPAAKLIPYAGELAAEAASKTGDWLSKERRSWQQRFDEATAALQKVGKPILILVDDIDRLQAQELLTLLKVIRLLGRFPGVQYLLAYDDQTLFRTIQESSLAVDRRSAERFMEKIVQYPLAMPPLLQQQQISLLESGLEAALAGAGRSNPAPNRLSQAFPMFLDLLTTPRAIERYLAQVRHNLALLPADEINDVDVILLCLVRTALPTVYRQLPRWREALLTGHTDEWDASRPSGFLWKNVDWTPLLSELEEQHRGSGRKILSLLFPKIDSQGADTDRARLERRICSEEYFDRYFFLSIPAHDVADREVVEALDAAMRGDAARLRQILLDDNRPRALLALKKGADIPPPSGKEAIVNLAITIARLAPVLRDSQAGFFDPHLLASRWAADLLAAMPSSTTAEEVLGALDGVGLETILDICRSGSRSSAAGWWQVMQEVLVERSTDLFIDNLQARDDASQDDGALHALYFALAYGGTNQVRRRIVDSLQRGLTTIPDLAGRLCSSVLPLGVANPRSRLSEFNQEDYNEIAPDTDDSFYQLPLDQTVDVYDTSWANRRVFAQGRARRPQPSVRNGMEET